MDILWTHTRHTYVRNKSYKRQHVHLLEENLKLFFSLLRIDPQNNQITPEDKLTVLCEITIDGKDVQQSGQAAAAMVCLMIDQKIILKTFIFRQNQSQRVKFVQRNFLPTTTLC